MIIFVVLFLLISLRLVAMAKTATPIMATTTTTMAMVEYLTLASACSWVSVLEMVFVI